MKSEFNCIRCGACCRWVGDVRLSDSDIDKIAGFLKLETAEFISSYTRLAKDRKCLSMIERENGDCIFYRHGALAECVIQPVKPEQCTGFPLRWAHQDWEQDCGAAKAKNGKDLESECE